jgi:hypothetical protein
MFWLSTDRKKQAAFRIGNSDADVLLNGGTGPLFASAESFEI